MSFNICESLSLSVRFRVESKCEPEPVSAKVWIPQVPLFSPSVFVDTLPTWHWLLKGECEGEGETELKGKG